MPTFVALFIWKRPVTHTGKLSLWLCLANVASWLIVVSLMTESGHPPPWLMVGVAVWVLNLPLLIAIGTLLWVSFRTREEKRAYLAVALTYLALNSLFLFIVPFVGTLIRR